MAKFSGPVGVWAAALADAAAAGALALGAVEAGALGDAAGEELAPLLEHAARKAAKPANADALQEAAPVDLDAAGGVVARFM